MFVATSCSDERVTAPGACRSMEVAFDAARMAATRASVLDAEVVVGDPARPAAEAPVQTRTELLEDGFSVKWSGDDRIALWARSENGTYAFAGRSFSLFSYILANEARFTGTVPEMTEGRYSYFAASPLPERIEGPKAIYTIPAVQDGIYRSERDLLVAYPVDGAQLGTDAAENPRMTMRHLCHALRIRIPEGRNRWGKPVNRLLVEFPVPVAGELTFDVSDPDATMTLAGASRAIELRFPEGWDESSADEPRYAWVFVAPGELDGQIDFTPLFDDGYCAETLSTPVLSKTMAAGHITPVTLTISDVEQSVTWIDFAIDHSQLGEPVNTLSIAAPEGAYFRGNVTQADLSAQDGRYSIGYYAKFYQAAFDGATMPATYDSDNAVVSNTIALGSLAADSRNTVAIQTPWLFYEDFSTVESFSSNDAYSMSSSGTKSAVSFLSGWTGARIGAQAGTSIRIACRRETSVGYPARVDSAPVSNLKEGASVKVSVSFDYGMNRQDGGIGTADIGQTCYLGYVKEATAFNSAATTGTFVSNFYIKEKTASYDNIPHKDGNYVFDGCDCNTRLTWRTERENKAGMNNNTCWLYLDNIRVSIAR